MRESARVLWAKPPCSGRSLQRATPIPDACAAPLWCVYCLLYARGLPTRDLKNHTTLVDGYLGMSNDEERSEMRYAVRIAEFRESSEL